MKAGRFILNSDLCTSRNSAEGKITLTIPNSVTAPAHSPNYTIATGVANVGDPSDSFNVFFTTDKYDYATPGPIAQLNPAGSSGLNGVFADVHKTGNQYKFKVDTGNSDQSVAQVYSGFGMTITAHIYTYKDPFSK